MANKDNKSQTDRGTIIASVIGAIGVVVAASVGLIANQSGKDTGQQAAFATITAVVNVETPRVVKETVAVLQTVEVPVTVVIEKRVEAPPKIETVVVTSPPKPSQIETVIVVVTATPEPTKEGSSNQVTTTPISASSGDTPSGTILEAGQTWRQGGLELKLPSAIRVCLPCSHNLNGLGLDNLVLTNRRSTTAVLTPLEVHVLDNNANKLTFGVADCFDCNANSGFSPIDSFDSAVIESGSSKEFGLAGQVSVARLFIPVDLTRPTLTEVIISASVSSITNARWRIPINR